MSAIQITRVGTIVLPVGDQQRALDWFTGTLGFEVRIDGAFGDGGRWIEVAPAGAATTIALVPGAAAGGGAAASPGALEVSFATRDAAADHARLLALGVDADPELIRMGEGVPPMFTFRDPDGNRFRVVERD